MLRIWKCYIIGNKCFDDSEKVEKWQTEQADLVNPTGMWRFGVFCAQCCWQRITFHKEITRPALVRDTRITYG